MSSESEPRTSVTLLGRLRGAPSDPAAWRDFVDRYGPQIHRWCRRWRLQDADAQDVAQIVLQKLAAAMSHFTYDRSRGGFRRWLKTVTHHAWRDFAASRHRLRHEIGADDRGLELLAAPDAADELAG